MFKKKNKKNLTKKKTIELAKQFEAAYTRFDKSRKELDEYRVRVAKEVGNDEKCSYSFLREELLKKIGELFVK